MPDDDWALGQNEVDVRNQARRERGYHRPVYASIEPDRAGECHSYIAEGDGLSPQQTAFCTGDTQCQAAADEHDLDCPVEQQLQDELGF